MAGAPMMRDTAPTNGSGAHAAANGSEGGDRVAAAVASLMDASVEEGRRRMASRNGDRAPLSHVSMKAWLVRALFLLTAATIVMATVLAGLGLLSVGEMAAVIAPVTTLGAAMFGFYFGNPDNA
jgi:hypothetical protein